MGYNADTNWNVTFRSEEAVNACLDELEELVDMSDVLRTDPERSVLDILAVFSEFSDGDLYGDDGLQLVGWTSGKLSYYDDDILAVCAKYADGSVEFRGEDGGLWLVRLKDNTMTTHNGQIVYPTDLGETT